MKTDEIWTPTNHPRPIKNNDLSALAANFDVFAIWGKYYIGRPYASELFLLTDSSEVATPRPSQ